MGGGNRLLVLACRHANDAIAPLYELARTWGSNARNWRIISPGWCISSWRPALRGVQSRGDARSGDARPDTPGGRSRWIWFYRIMPSFISRTGCPQLPRTAACALHEYLTFTSEVDRQHSCSAHRARSLPRQGPGRPGNFLLCHASERGNCRGEYRWRHCCGTCRISKFSTTVHLENF